VTPLDVAANLRVVRDRIVAAGGDPARVRVVAVTKGFGPEAVEAARAAGLDDVGENYAQEMLAKRASFGDLTVHFIGRLQTNKVRLVAALVDCWQSVDRLALADEIARRAPGARILVQVNVSDEPQKGGCAPSEAGELVRRCRDLGLVVSGLMTVGRTGDPDAVRPGFALLSGLADRLGLPERSMGMTHDLEAAVTEGATMIRVGTALFGNRPPDPSRGN